jgi:hypothetical protein
VQHPSRLVSIFTSEFNGATYGPSSYEDVSLASETCAFAAVAAIDDAICA